MPAQKQEQEQYSEENLTLELHKSFLYQIVSNLNSKNGSYISRRLSKNYGVLKLHTSRIETYIVAFLSLVLFIIGYILPYVFHVGIPTIWGEPEMWNQEKRAYRPQLIAYTFSKFQSYAKNAIFTGVECYQKLG